MQLYTRGDAFRRNSIDYWLTNILALNLTDTANLNMQESQQTGSPKLTQADHSHALQGIEQKETILRITTAYKSVLPLWITQNSCICFHHSNNIVSVENLWHSYCAQVNRMLGAGVVLLLQSIS